MRLAETITFYRSIFSPGGLACCLIAAVLFGLGVVGAEFLPTMPADQAKDVDLLMALFLAVDQ